MITLDSKIQDLAAAILCSAEKQVLKKAVFSKHIDKSILKTVVTLKSISGRLCLQAESFHSDNKAKHENISLDGNAAARLCEMIASCMQVNLITTVGECEYKASKSGKITLIGVNNLVLKIKGSDNTQKADISGNNHEKTISFRAMLHFLSISE